MTRQTVPGIMAGDLCGGDEIIRRYSQDGLPLFDVRRESGPGRWVTTDDTAGLPVGTPTRMTSPSGSHTIYGQSRNTGQSPPSDFTAVFGQHTYRDLRHFGWTIERWARA